MATRLTELHQRLAAQQTELELLNQELFAQARIDPLTQLASRRKLAEDLEMVSGRVERYRERYCAVMCDIDHFKLFNDTYGRPAGDRVLQSVQMYPRRVDPGEETRPVRPASEVARGSRPRSLCIIL